MAWQCTTNERLCKQLKTWRWINKIDAFTNMLFYAIELITQAEMVLLRNWARALTRLTPDGNICIISIFSFQFFLGNIATSACMANEELKTKSQASPSCLWKTLKTEKRVQKLPRHWLFTPVANKKPHLEAGGHWRWNRRGSQQKENQMYSCTCNSKRDDSMTSLRYSQEHTKSCFFDDFRYVRHCCWSVLNCLPFWNTLFLQWSCSMSFWWLFYSVYMTECSNLGKW